MEISDSSVHVLYDFEYTAKDGQNIKIKEGEKLLLIKKTNKDWWQVIRSNGKRPFFVPSNYVKETAVSSTTKQTVIDNKRFTVSVNVKPPPNDVALNNNHHNNFSNNRSMVYMNSSESLTGSDISDDKSLSVQLADSNSKYSVVKVRKKKPNNFREAKILEDESNLSESLLEMAQKIKFLPNVKSNDVNNYNNKNNVITGDNKKLCRYPGSLKLEKRKFLFHKQLSKSLSHIDNIVDHIIDFHEFKSSYECRTPESSCDSFDNNLESSSENLKNDIDYNIPEKPVPKPRRLVIKQKEEVVYANWMELRRHFEDPPDERQKRLEEIHNKKVESEEENKKEKDFEENKIKFVEVPMGWTRHFDSESHLPCYVHMESGQKWYSSKDEEGRTYFFKENSNESSWSLPDLPCQRFGQNVQQSHKQISEDLSAVFHQISSSSVDAKKIRSAKAYSMFITNKQEQNEHHQQSVQHQPAWKGESWPNYNMAHYWPNLNERNDMNVIVFKEHLNYTKIQDSKKRTKKNWCPVYVTLTELFVVIYKDNKSSVPELTLDLNGAEVSSGEKVTNRKHVLVITNQLGLTIALQCENAERAVFWGSQIKQAILNLPKALSKIDSPKQNSKFVGNLGDVPEESRKSVGIGRSKSVNFKNKEDSMEDLGVAERQMKIKARLKKFFQKRPTMESLVKKGIWKDEPVFGCYLEQACGNNVPKVPLFVQKVVQIIESSVENMKTDGLYRASGNLSQIQKIRLQIDQNNYSVLDQEEDVHVLTGALKLFFRELKEPLIPYKLLPKAIKASTTNNRKEKLNLFNDVIKALPTPNRDTLKFLLQHLLRVTQYQEFNRMHSANVAIVFGPTLMWSLEQEIVNMAMDMMQQNMVIEAFLSDYDIIFNK